MIPTVAQQISAVRTTIAKNVLPALDPNDSFAAEQAGLVLACLDWTLDVHTSEYRYERVEHSDYRALLARLIDLAPTRDAEEERAFLSAAAEPPVDLERLREQTRALKEMADRRYGILADAEPELAQRARQVMAAAAGRQCERELAWCRKTGFPRGADESVAHVLDRQQADPPPGAATSAS
ncbi:hypothetical protein [Nocardia jiangxiensis]|uniref:Uncharacterized protein n=1 Tax=Nocardia jiangxiensis TaxID=282685 RepID=A0ABW6S8S7_9NOCA|nr:hypothetical protein [Nocardia jiangxiensis]